MKYIVLLISFFVSFFNFSFSQDEEINSSLLWEITGKKVKSPSYLFGTIHMIPQEDFYFPESLQEKVADSDILIMEIGGFAEQMKGIRLLMLESGNLFDDFFSKEQLDTLFTYAEEYLDMNEEKMRTSFSTMKPFVLVQVLSKDQFGENPESYELSLEKIAQKNKVKIGGLETIEEQISIIDNLEKSAQTEMVMSSIREAIKGESSQQLRELIDLYLAQDVEEIYKFMTESSLNTENFEEEMLINRNKKWIKPIQKIIKKEKAFIAVGAGHLGGENGVIKLLQKEGYTLTPIQF